MSRFANGNVREFERVAGSTHPGAVIIVPVLDTGDLVLVREYAVGLERYELSLPMGLVQMRETTLEAANRELQEETGFAARDLLRARSRMRGRSPRCWLHGRRYCALVARKQYEHRHLS